MRTIETNTMFCVFGELFVFQVFFGRNILGPCFSKLANASAGGFLDAFWLRTSVQKHPVLQMPPILFTAAGITVEHFEPAQHGLEVSDQNVLIAVFCCTHHGQLAVATPFNL